MTSSGGQTVSTTSQTVLFVSHDASHTGAPIFLLRLLRWLRANSQVSFRILVGNDGPLLPEFEALGPVDFFEPELTTAYRMLRRLNLNDGQVTHHRSSLREKLGQSNIRLVYSNTIANGRILDFLSFLNCPVVTHVHELDHVIRHALGESNLTLVKKYSHSYVAVSHAVKTNLVENCGIPGDKVRVVHGFVPTNGSCQRDIALPENPVRQELGVSSGSRLVCACGSIEPRKGTDLFLQVAASVMQMHKAATVHFVWVGGRSEAVKEARRKAASLSLQNVVHFLGPRPDVIPYYDAADIFLLPSREDPFPLVMLEAALQGKPIVCFDNSGGAPEFVEQDAGFVVPGFDVEEMAKKVVYLLNTDAVRNRMGAIGRQKVLDRHNLDASAPRIAALIGEALSAPQSLEHSRTPVDAS
jgi:glycosyltransferase involved in cell wall biosynthesis